MLRTPNARGRALAFLFLAGCTAVVTGCTVGQTSSSAGGKAGNPNASGDEGGGGKDPAPAGDALPAELTGTWLDRWSVSMQYSLATNAYDFDTQVWFGGLPDLWDMAPNRGLGIAFGADGSFLWIRSEDGGLGGCKSYAVRVSKGTASVVGNAIRFHPTAQRERYESVCDPSLNYDKPIPNEDFDLDYVLGATQDTGLPTLQLTDASSNTSLVFFQQ